ncbi:MAG: PSD1 and planctomycete cytochrome C domain-containing protein [Verrucomicrobiota bacterium]
MKLVLVLISALALEAVASDVGHEFFEQKIRPVLVEYCYECHSAEAGKQKGGLLVDTRDGIRKGGATADAIVPGNVELSLLLTSIGYQNEELQMPPDHQLPASVVADFVKWVEMGAPDPREGESKPPTQIAVADHWAYQPPQAQQLPEVSDATWARNRLDYFVLAKLDESGLKPNDDADPRTLIRRATLELTGLPPTPEEIDEFLKDCEERDLQSAFAKVVDRLLASEGFGIRWARHWLDVARYAESSGYTRNMTYPLAWRYRNWVIDAFNSDKPYRDFIREQIAGDLLPNTGDVQIQATAFLTIGPKTLNEGDILQFDLNVADEQIDATCRAFLALTVNCARCHDHKYDPIPADDYYALAGIFRSSKNLAAVATNVRKEHVGEHPLGPDGWEQVLAFEEHKRHADEMQAIYIQVIKGRQMYRDYLEEIGLDWKTADDPDHAAAEELVQFWKKKVEEARANPPEYPEVSMAVVEGDVLNSPVFDKGLKDQPLDKTHRGVITMFGYESPPIASNESGRLQLADWIVDERNPLTARVIVNRVWHHLFGIGIVESVDNFGALGALPSNQQLLDDLALRFTTEHDWSLKRLIRSIVLSRTYTLSSSHHEAAFAIDPGNRLNWRFAPQPLEGEAIRDSILAISGKLDASIAGPSQITELSAKQPNPQQREIGRRDFIVKDITDAIPQRSIFLPWPRAVMLDSMTTFDAADPNIVIGARRLTTLPKQAMFLMNAPFVIESAEATAARVQAAEDPVGEVYLRVLGREPDEAERQAIQQMVSSDPNAWTQVCQSLFCLGEFRTIY